MWFVSFGQWQHEELAMAAYSAGCPGLATVPVSPEALYCCSCTRPPPLSICDSHGCFTRQKPSSFSHVHPQRLCFPPQLLAFCLPMHTPTAGLHPRVQGWFLPSQTTASRNRWHQPGASPCQVTSGAARAHGSPHGLPAPGSAGAPLQSTGAPQLTATVTSSKLKEKNQGEIWAEQLLRGCLHVRSASLP